jgi:secreted protein with Ig-like and vWFA domain
VNDKLVLLAAFLLFADASFASYEVNFVLGVVQLILGSLILAAIGAHRRARRVRDELVDDALQRLRDEAARAKDRRGEEIKDIQFAINRLYTELGKEPPQWPSR